MLIRPLKIVEKRIVYVIEIDGVLLFGNNCNGEISISDDEVV